MKYSILFILIISHSIPLFGQESNLDFESDSLQESNKEILQNRKVVIQQPVPVGGMAEIYKLINRELKYPAEAKRNGIEGVVYVEFIVDENGNIPKDFITINIGLSSDLNMEAMRLIAMMPKWKPARGRNGIPVKCKMILPIKFSI